MEKSLSILRVVLNIGIMFISSLPAYGQIDQNYGENQKKAFASSSAAECRSSLKFFNEVLKVAPNHPVMRVC